MLAKQPASTANTPVRPPQILVPIIAEGLRRVKRDVVEIGKAMAEARQQMKYAAFLKWSAKCFGLKKRQALYYLEMGRSGALSAPTKKSKKAQHNRTTGARSNGHAAAASSSAAASPQVYQVCIEIIETGFRALAKTRHPDKGGSAAAMDMLNKARKELRAIWR